jgi:hypothetical protein
VRRQPSLVATFEQLLLSPYSLNTQSDTRNNQETSTFIDRHAHHLPLSPSTSLSSSSRNERDFAKPDQMRRLLQALHLPLRRLSTRLVLRSNLSGTRSSRFLFLFLPFHSSLTLSSTRRSSGQSTRFNAARTSTSFAPHRCRSRKQKRWW